MFNRRDYILRFKTVVFKFATVIIQEGKQYVAHAVELGVVSQGKTLSAALENLKEAVELYLQDNPRAKRLISKKATFLTTLELQNA